MILEENVENDWEKCGEEEASQEDDDEVPPLPFLLQFGHKILIVLHHRWIEGIGHGLADVWMMGDF